MPSETMPARLASADMPRSHSQDGSYLDWASILAGGVFALAISSLLISFGAGLGLSLTSPYRGEGVSVSWLAIAAGIWFAWVMVTSFGAGGYLAGRMRRHAGDATPDEVEARDGVHGLMVWATGALFSIVLAASGVGGLIGAGTSAVGSTAGTIADVAEEAVSADYFADLMLRSASGSENGASRNTNVSPEVRQEIAGIIARSAANGQMVERDRGYLAQLVAANSDLDQAAARSRIDEVNAEIGGIREAAVAAAEKARAAGVVFGFVAAATLLIGAVTAYFAATTGGRHRDEGLGLDGLTARR